MFQTFLTTDFYMRKKNSTQKALTNSLAGDSMNGNNIQKAIHDYSDDPFLNEFFPEQQQKNMKSPQQLPLPDFLNFDQYQPRSDYDYPLITDEGDDDQFDKGKYENDEMNANIGLLARPCHPWNVPFDSKLVRMREKPYSSEILVYKVQFKVSNGSYAVGNSATANFGVGDYVVVEADRGEDIGVITSCQLRNVTIDNLNGEEVKPFRQIYRFATIGERHALQQKEHDENQAIRVCEGILASLYEIPIKVIDVVFQFDRKKLTVYYGSEYSVNFRPFIRELYCLYKSRIWLERVYSPAQQLAQQQQQLQQLHVRSPTMSVGSSRSQQPPYHNQQEYHQQQQSYSQQNLPLPQFSPTAHHTYPPPKPPLVEPSRVPSRPLVMHPLQNRK